MFLKRIHHRVLPNNTISVSCAHSKGCCVGHLTCRCWGCWCVCPQAVAPTLSRTLPSGRDFPKYSMSTLIADSNKPVISLFMQSWSGANERAVVEQLKKCKERVRERDLAPPKFRPRKVVFSVSLPGDDILCCLLLCPLSSVCFLCFFFSFLFFYEIVPGLIWFSSIYLMTTAGFVEDQLMGDKQQQTTSRLTHLTHRHHNSDCLSQEGHVV